MPRPPSVYSVEQFLARRLVAASQCLHTLDIHPQRVHLTSIVILVSPRYWVHSDFESGWCVRIQLMSQVTGVCVCTRTRQRAKRVSDSPGQWRYRWLCSCF